jgi:ribosomal protein L37AE/L43A
MVVRLRNCCRFCGSLNIRKVKSLKNYHCNVCNQSFAIPSTKMDNTYSGLQLTLSAESRDRLMSK